MNNDFDEKKSEEILKLYETKKETFKDAVDYFDFSSKDNLFQKIKIVNMVDFGEFQNVLSLYEKKKKRINQLIESFDEKKEITLVACKQNGCVCTILDDNITKIIQFNSENVLDECLTEEQKCTEFLNLKYFDKNAFENIVDYFEKNCIILLFSFQFFQ